MVEVEMNRSRYWYLVMSNATLIHARRQLRFHVLGFSANSETVQTHPAGW